MAYQSGFQSAHASGFQSGYAQIQGLQKKVPEQNNQELSAEEIQNVLGSEYEQPQYNEPSYHQPQNQGCQEPAYKQECQAFSAGEIQNFVGSESGQNYVMELLEQNPRMIEVLEEYLQQQGYHIPTSDNEPGYPQTQNQGCQEPAYQQEYQELGNQQEHQLGYQRLAYQQECQDQGYLQSQDQECQDQNCQEPAYQQECQEPAYQRMGNQQEYQLGYQRSAYEPEYQDQGYHHSQNQGYQEPAYYQEQTILNNEEKDAKIIPGQNPVQPKTADGRQTEKKSDKTSINIFYHQYGRTWRNGRLNNKPKKKPGIMKNRSWDEEDFQRK